MILGLTATYERLDNRHVLLDKYCPVIDELSLEDALKNGWISPFIEYQVILDVEDIDYYNSLNKEFTSHFEFFNFDFNLAMSTIGPKGYLGKTKLRDLMCPNGSDSEKSKMLNAISYHSRQLMSTMQKRKSFINNHPKKIEVARKIIAARPDSKIITFSNNVRMAETIGIGDVYTGKLSKKKGDQIIQDFNSCFSGVLNSCARLNEGADLKGLSVAIILGLDSSKTKTTQRIGRVCRFEEGKQAEIFNLVINDTAECKWFQNSHEGSIYKTIDESGLEKVLNGEEPEPYRRKIKDINFRY